MTTVDDASPRSPGRRARIALIVLLAAAAVLRIAFGWNEVGIYWPDEVYQSLEMGHRFAFGYSIIPWEFIDGARNWTLPGLIGIVMKVASWIGLDDPAAYLRLVRMLFASLGVLATWGAYRLAKAYRANDVSALAGAALFGLTAVPLYFSHRAMSETASTAPAIWGLVLLLESVPSTSRVTLRRILGASLLGLSVLIRLQLGLFCVGAVLILLGRKRWRDAGISFAVLCVWAFLFGLMDKLTWGGWFHSAIKYLQFNLVEGKAAGWGTAPFTYYARVMWQAMPGPSIVLLATVLVASRRAFGVFALAMAFIALHAWTPHKELRFIVPILPVMAALAGIGLEEIATFLKAPQLRIALAVIVAVFALHSAAQTPKLTFGQLGAYENQRPNDSAWGDAASVNRLLLAAHRQKDVCGLKIESVHLAWAGGQSYLHLPVHLYSHAGPPRQFGFYNYVVTFNAPQYTAGTEVIAVDGPMALAHLPIADCRPDPRFSDRLP